MKAAVYCGDRRFAIQQSRPEPPGPGEVLLRVAYCGICGTDIHIFHGAMDHRVRPPSVIGHEASAVVQEVGEGVEGISPGDIVAVRPLEFGPLTPYDKGFQHVSRNMKVMGVDLPGAMQTWWKVPSYTIHRLPKGLPLTVGALIEPTAVACHSVRLSQLVRDEVCVVIGGGPIGLLISLVAREKGARVTLFEINQARLELARSLGLSAFDPNEVEPFQLVEGRTQGAMADVVFEVSGSTRGVEIMSELTSVRGRIVIVAIHPKPQPVDLLRVFLAELRIIGVRLYEPEDFEEAIELASKRGLPLERLITQIRPIEEVQQVFQLIDESPEGMKYLIQCS
jgi:2-desacetyl-2-hydroxyethyl bacteriochlorophyllide A dehydrogenase